MSGPVAIRTPGGGSVEWGTPRWLFDILNEEFRFELDAAASAENALCEKYFTAEQDALTQEWRGKVFLNPPFAGAVPAFVRKAHEESHKGAVVVAVLPAAVDAGWFHEHVVGHAEIRFIRGRLHHVRNGEESRCPFASMVVIWEGDGTENHDSDIDTIDARKDGKRSHETGAVGAEEN